MRRSHTTLAVALLAMSAIVWTGVRWRRSRPMPDAPAASRPEARGPMPVVSASVNDTGRVELFRGTPLLVHVTVLHPRAFEPAESAIHLTLVGPRGSWSDVVRIDVTTPQGVAERWAFQLANAPTGSISLDSQTWGDLDWSLSPEETAGIPDGTYDIVAVLDTRHAPSAGAWNGEASSPAATVTVRSHPATLSATEDADTQLRLAQFHTMLGDPDKAMADVDALLSRQPESGAALEMKADLLSAAGHEEQVLQLYDRAIATFFKEHPHPQELPTELLDARAAMRARIVARRQ